VVLKSMCSSDPLEDPGSHRRVEVPSNRSRRHRSRSPGRIGRGQRRWRPDRRRRRDRARSRLDPGPRRHGRGGRRFYRVQREQVAAAAGGLRIRSWSRRVDAKKGGGGEKRGGGNDTGRRGQVGWWLAPLYSWAGHGG
jgi:hypothetical protein